VAAYDYVCCLSFSADIALKDNYFGLLFNLPIFAEISLGYPLVFQRRSFLVLLVRDFFTDRMSDNVKALKENLKTITISCM